ncbi:RNA-guided endonuclease InsQ/TnpB family protein [Paenibacillus chungangensis]|uniref:RNA-guided endonuclease InsQ/TnpB family protein n=1 Tax=Paenibacillus chungangensis TaxID=696535 RepID=A0ABW3HNM5_9BACL
MKKKQQTRRAAVCISGGFLIGIDLGVSQLAITSDGDRIESPKFLRKSEEKLKRKQRAVSKKKHGSNRLRKAVRDLARLHEKVANQRRDYAHKKSRELINTYGLIAFEDLNIQGMVKNRHLVKSIADSGWNQLIQFEPFRAYRSHSNPIRLGTSLQGGTRLRVPMI